MSENRAAAGTAVVRGARILDRAAPQDPRRTLQLALAVVWLLDGMLQFQPFMFSKGFQQMLAGAAPGNPAVVARPIAWDAAFIAHHLTVFNAIFAAFQVALGLGIAWPPTVRFALASSVAWSMGVWWLGEGLGGVLTGTASPLTGAPGAVILYALLAVLLWPATRDRAAPFAAARAVGTGTARVLWTVLWASLAFFALLPASRAPGAASGTFSAVASGQPGWLSRADLRIAGVLAGQGLLTSVLLAAALAAVAVSMFLPARAARAGVVLAIAVAAFIWLAQGLGAIFTGGGTDPNSGPLLALLAIAFWPGPAPWRCWPVSPREGA
jgi:hypothetical protein